MTCQVIPKILDAMTTHHSTKHTVKVALLMVTFLFVACTGRITVTPTYDDALNTKLLQAWNAGASLRLDELAEGDWDTLVIAPEGTRTDLLERDYGIKANWDSDYFTHASLLLIFMKGNVPVRASMVSFNSVWRDYYLRPLPRTSTAVFDAPKSWLRVTGS